MTMPTPESQEPAKEAITTTVDASPLDKLNRLGESHGELKPGNGMASGVFAFCLAFLALLGVIGFHFPAYLSTCSRARSRS